ncbi:T6SS phospholipase effector Tle1-like catalytic domain-containing protein [Curvivirga sp.]|uniref:T6SS phospholipase effector Tle1-like catalytic domain-containing protein n=1 Tax=Curvivirga sp. TaxID=2856848 RepID=UPI003B5CE530
MSKKIIICFDGTANEPEDAHQRDLGNGRVEDDGISNVLKLYFLLGGRLKNLNKTSTAAGASSKFPNQYVYYFQGVGTYGGFFRKFINMTLSPTCSDVDEIIGLGAKAISNTYQPGDEIYLFGFSRGAAIARKFASLVKKYIPEDSSEPVIRFMGVFDTVISFNAPNLSREENAYSKVKFENGNRVSENVEEALHLVSLDEQRLAFRPTLMQAESRVTEIWFPGVHSDIGGGYFHDGLSDITLQFMCEEMKRRKLNMAFRTPQKIAQKEFKNNKYGLGPEDIEIIPRVDGKLHWHKRPANAFLKNRNILKCISGADASSNQKPLIHTSAFQRAQKFNDYYPTALNEGQLYQEVNDKGKIQKVSTAKF